MLFLVWGETMDGIGLGGIVGDSCSVGRLFDSRTPAIGADSFLFCHDPWPAVETTAT